MTACAESAETSCVLQRPYECVCNPQAPAADDAFGSSDSATASTPSTKSTGDFASDSGSSQKVKSSDDSPAPPKRSPPNSPTTAPDNFRRRLLAF